MARVNSVRDFVEGFVKNTLGGAHTHGGWFLEPGEVVLLKFKSSSSKVENIRNDATGEYERRVSPKIETVAARMKDGSCIVNANHLEHATGRQAWGAPISYNRDGRADCQIWAEEAGAIPIAFTIFNEVPGADIRNFSWVVKPVSGGESITVYDLEHGKRNKDTREMEYPLITRHFVGSCIFSIKDEHFLFDIDRQEVNNHLMTPFVVKLPRTVSSVEEAYDALMPAAVKEAMADGVEVKRQGEFFFVYNSVEAPRQDITSLPTLTSDERQIAKYPPSKYGFGLPGRGRGYSYGGSDCEPLRDMNNNNPVEVEFQEAALRYSAVLEKMRDIEARKAAIEPQRGAIQKDGGRSHRVEQFVQVGDVQYVSGEITHTRNEHSPLKLIGWWKVVPNSAVKSFIINGDVD